MILEWLSGMGWKLLLILGVAAGLFFLIKDDISIHKQLSDTVVNQKSLEQGMLIYKNKAGQLQTMTIQEEQTIDQLKASKDTVIQHILVQAKKDDISTNKIVEVGEVVSKLVHDTTVVYTPGRDTTISFSHVPYVVNTVTLKGDSASNKLEVNGKEDLIFHDQRVTVDPPKKFFLLRWFQKHQTLVEVDVTNTNPYIQVENQKFVHTVK